jgi:hypothetical protein
MKIRITSKGTPGSTRVVNAETGDELKNVTHIAWTVGVDGLSVATITVLAVPVDVIAEASPITDEPASVDDSATGFAAEEHSQ